MNHTNFSAIFNYSGSGSISNFTNNLINKTLEGEGEEEGPSQAAVIFSYIVIVFLCIFMCLCVSVFCYMCISECHDSYYERPIYIGRDNRFRSYDSYGFSSDSESDTGTHDTSEEYPKSRPYEVTINKLIIETPLDKIVLPETEGNLHLINPTCSICLDEINLQKDSPEKVVQLSCGHIYHQKCISKWCFGGITSVANCPLCRQKMDHIVIKMEQI